MNTTERVARLVERGVSEVSARKAVADLQREKLSSLDILVGGALSMADDMPEVEPVQGPMFHRGQLVTLTARPGGGKSTFGMSSAVALALRRNLGVIEPAAKGLVYYVSAEDFASTGLRIQAEAIRHRLTPDERAELDGQLRWAHINATLHPSLIAEAIDKDAGGSDVSIVHIDTGPALFAGDDENSNAQLQDFASSCRELTRLPGAPCCVVNWHPQKSATADNLVPRGGSALLGAVDANLTLWREDDSLTLGYTKLRSLHFDPLRFALELVPLTLSSGRRVDIPVATPVTELGAEELDGKVRDRREAVLLALAGCERTTVRDVAKRALGDERKRSTVQRDLADMMRAKPALVEQDPIGHGYSLTNAGKKAAEATLARRVRDYREASNGA